MKKKLLISFSGGRTSAYMLFYLFYLWPQREDYKMIVVFANTGKEAEGTLVFIERCSKEWDIPVVWVEYTPGSKKGWSVIPKIVDFNSASRKGEPFELMLSKIGIPHNKAPFCSRTLKKDTIKAYLKSIGWKKYETAIGIRVDEIDRMNPHFKKQGIIYPLIRFKETTKPEILEWWKHQSFDLNIDPDEGNCDGCWKKSMLVLTRIARKNPHVFDWWQKMTDSYGFYNPRNVASPLPFNFYRGNLSPKDIFKLSLMPDKLISKMATKEKLNGCSESCEPF